jgi:uncharacterized protein with FMN-binding domain
MRRRLIAVIGFILGVILILFNYPSEVLTSPQIAESEEIIKPSVGPSPSDSSTPSPKQEPKEEVVLPTTTPNPTPTVSETKSPQNVIAVGDVVAAGKYGQVQVQITINGGVVISAKALMFPNADSRSSSISATAIPQLIKQSINVMSSEEIQGVSGASYTSEAWRESLASALAGAL